MKLVARTDDCDPAQPTNCDITVLKHEFDWPLAAAIRVRTLNWCETHSRMVAFIYDGELEGVEAVLARRD